MEPRTRCRAQLFLCENVKILHENLKPFGCSASPALKDDFAKPDPTTLYARFLEPISDGSSWTVVRFVVHSHRWFNFSDIYTFGGLDARVEDRVFFLSKLRVSAV